GTHPNAGTLSVTVNNVPPTIALSGDSGVDEGSVYTLNLGAITDPGNDDTIVGYIIDWGDGTIISFDRDPTSTTSTHTYTTDTNRLISYTTLYRAGTHPNAGTLSVTVNNVPPTIALSGDSSVDEGSVYTLNLGAITDPGNDDTIFGYNIDWGDGTVDS